MKCTNLTLIGMGVLVLCIYGCKGAEKLGVERALPSGIRFIMVEDQRGPTADTGDQVEVHLDHYTIDDSLLFSTRSGGMDAVSMKVQDPEYHGDIKEVFQYMSEGDSALAYVPADSIYRDGFRPSFAGPGVILQYRLRLLRHETGAAYRARLKREAREAYHQDSIDLRSFADSLKLNVQFGIGGLGWAIQSGTSGMRPTSGDTVKVHYELQNLAGRKLDSSFDRGEPFEFVIDAGQVIPGWDKGIPAFAVGETGWLLIPSTLAYGERGAGRDIPPHTPLAFRIQLVEVRPHH